MLTTLAHTRLRTRSLVPPLARTLPTLAIRREDPSRIWERRSPLSPSDVRGVLESYKGKVDVLVEPSAKRCWTDAEYAAAGAHITPDLDPASLILGIKEPPPESVFLSPAPDGLSREYLFFSHTHKGQPHNLPLLRRFLSGGPTSPRLMDYELLTDSTGQRVISFGWMAGAVGASEALSSFALHALELGYATPFLHVPRPYTHLSLSYLRAALRLVGERVRAVGTPRKLGAITIGLTGAGRVSTGARAMLDELGVRWVEVEELKPIAEDPNADTHQIYAAFLPPHSYLSSTTSEPYTRTAYRFDPSSFTSHFGTSIAPHLSILINGAGWQLGFPRLLSLPELDRARAAGGGKRMLTVADLACDIEGGIPFVTRSTTIDSPFFYTPTTPSGRTQIMSIDILPSELPFDASQTFSSALVPYLRAWLDARLARGTPSKTHLDALERATIARGGELAPAHRALGRLVDGEVGGKRLVDGQGAKGKGERKKRVLVLGSGMVALPAVQCLAERSDVEVVIASNALPEASQLAAGLPNVSARLLDVSDRASLSELIAQSDVVISLVPAPAHPPIAELCIEHRKQFVTASYVSPGMRALHERALGKDVLLLNECGLDPGIDHMSAYAMIDEAEKEGKTVTSFVSWCGGLPTPEASNVPLRYKFSWSPRGVLIAASNPAQFLLNGQLHEVPGPQLLISRFASVPLDPGTYDFEGLANRDSLPYANEYGIAAPRLKTVLRGTLRYKGFSELMHVFKTIGLLEDGTFVQPGEWTRLVNVLLEGRTGGRVRDELSRRAALKDLLGEEKMHGVLEPLEWLSLIPPSSSSPPTHFSPAPRTPLPALPRTPSTPLTLLSTLLSSRLAYAPTERDLVYLSHELTLSSGEVRTSRLAVRGDAQSSAMAKTVGLPVALAALRVLDGRVAGRGVRGPREVGGWVLERLRERGVEMQERTGGRGMAQELERSWERPKSVA